MGPINDTKLLFFLRYFSFRDNAPPHRNPRQMNGLGISGNERMPPPEVLALP